MPRKSKHAIPGEKKALLPELIKTVRRKGDGGPAGGAEGPARGGDPNDAGAGD